MELNETQFKALKQINELMEWKIRNLDLTKENCWFAREELDKVTERTLYVLIQKKYLDHIYKPNHDYYKLI